MSPAKSSGNLLVPQDVPLMSKLGDEFVSGIVVARCCKNVFLPKAKFWSKRGPCVGPLIGKGCYVRQTKYFLRQKMFVLPFVCGLSILLGPGLRQGMASDKNGFCIAKDGFSGKARSPQVPHSWRLAFHERPLWCQSFGESKRQ